MKISTEIELETTVEIDGAKVIVAAHVEVDGAYYPASWGRDGGSPEEWPDSTIVKVVATNDETGADYEIPVAKLSKADADRIEGRAIEVALEEAHD